MPISTVFSAIVKPFRPREWQNRSMMMVYGISNCDTVKKARMWLTAQGLAYTFHDFKKQGVPAAQLPNWAAAVGWEKLLNRQGSTWRKLGSATQANAETAKGAQSLALVNPSVIKRPVVQWPNGAVTVGFNDTRWTEMAQKQLLACKAVNHLQQKQSNTP